MSEPGESRPFPWDEAMALGLGVLRWPPDAFWRATPAELFAALRGPARASAVEPATGRDVDRLMRAFPDDGIDGDHR
jgi:uncharacterized phage protein (TIGR02216 family)